MEAQREDAVASEACPEGLTRWTRALGSSTPQMMSKRATAGAHRISREEAGCIEFNAALEGYLDGSDPAELLSAAGMVAGSAIPLHPVLAAGIAKLTGCACQLLDYGDAGRAVRRWFAVMAEPGARH